MAQKPVEKDEQAIREARNAYMRQWRAKNPERAKKIADNFYLRLAKQQQEEKRNG